MPWAKLTYERTVTVYKELLNDLHQKSRSDLDLVVKEALIRAEILKHVFTKRQLVIISLIITMSFPYGKDKALIPKLRDFEIAGISSKKIRHELDKLKEMNVVGWNDENEYWIEEARFWKAPYNVGYNDNRSRELFLLNLKHAGIDITEIVEKLKKLGY